MKITITEIKTGYTALFEYREDGQLIRSEYPDVDIATLKAFYSVTRLHASELEKVAQRWHKVLRIEEVQSLDFDSFWKAYNYKVGSKPATQKLWDKLPDADKYNALKAIRKYDNYLNRTGTAKIYPERYLKHRRWEDEY
ncbi:MAG: hypothetical protein M9892_03355 [Bacteroidetes bacterium]|nr:hypothetical protein [Bacteroidota bacterium]